MPRRQIDDDSNKVTWIGKPIENEEGVDCYSRCICNEFILRLGDFVHVSNPDKPSNGKRYDVVKITRLFEIIDPLALDDYKYQACVESYKRPSDIPRELSNLVPDLDWDREVILNPTDFTCQLPLDAIHSICRVMFCEPTENVSSAVGDGRRNRNVYICRYKIVNKNGVLSLAPVCEQYVNNSPKTTPRKRLVSPIKIVNKNSVQKVSKLNHYDIENILSESDCDQNETPTKILGSLDRHGNSGARRNLNSSLNEAANGVLMGSIVDSPHNKNDGLKMTIKVRREDSSNAATPLKQIQYCDNELDNMPKRKSASKHKSKPDLPSITLPESRYKNTDQIEYNRAITDTPKSILKSVSVRLKKWNCSRRSISFEPSRKDKDITSSDKNEATTPPSSSPPLRRSTRRASVKQTNLAESPADVSFGDVFDSPETLEISPKKSRKSRSRSQTPSRSAVKTPSRSVIKTPERPAVKTPNGSVIKRRGRPAVKTPSRSVTKSETLTPTRTPKRPSKRTPSTRISTLMPVIDERVSPVKKTTSNVQLAKESLHVSAVPKSLPCRENEFESIYSFIEGKILDHSGGCMYISGVPGTGKTATITEVIRSLQHQVKQRKLSPFEFVEINGMRMTEPRQAYVQIYQQLTGQTVPWEQALSLLEKRFKAPIMKRKTTVLLVDELDMLCNLRQDVVYNLLDWPTSKSAQLVVVTIANTMDLPERLLMGRVTSRLGLTRLTFQPYSFKQLQEVVQARLMGTNVFQSDAVQLVARKVASMSGDCRRALDICRRSTEIAEMNCLKKENVMVSMEHVQKAFNEMIANPKVLAIKNCSKFEQLFIKAVEAEVARTGVDETNLFRVYQQYESICALNGVDVPDPGAALRISSKLGSSRLLICEHSSAAIHQKIMLNISQDDIYYALHV